MPGTLFSKLAEDTLASVATEQPKAASKAAGDPMSAIYEVAQERGINPEHLLGLAKLETRAGEKTVRGNGADTLNLFNIKDFGGGGTRALDKAEGSRDAYRQYASYRESVDDLAGLLERKYPGALAAKSPEEFALALKRGGYATDPNYVDKLTRTIHKSSAVGRSADIAADIASSWDQGARYVPMDQLIDQGGQPVQQKPAKSPSLLRGTANVGLSLGQGITGSVKSLTDLVGADNAVSRTLDDASKGLEGLKSDESQQLRQYHQQRIKAAEASGDWKQEVGAYVDMLWDMPAESVAQAVGSFATLGVGKAAQMAKLASAAKKAGVGKEAFLKTAQGIEAARRASDLGAKVNVGIGVGQGIGAVKGSQYEQTFNTAKASGLDDDQAKILATEAQSYREGYGQQLLGAGLGYVAGKTGPIEKLASGKTVGAGGVARRFVGGGAVEATTEGAQGAQERYAGNAAAIGQGVLGEDRRYAGVVGGGVSEGLMGGIVGGGAGALGRPDVDPLEQSKVAAKKSGGIVSRAGLAAAPESQPAQPASGQPAPGATTVNPAQAGAAGQPGPAPAAPINPIQASAQSAIEQALAEDKARRRAAGEVVDGDEDVIEDEVVATGGGTDPFVGLFDTDEVYANWSNVRDGTDRDSMRSQIGGVLSMYAKADLSAYDPVSLKYELSNYKWFRNATKQQQDAGVAAIFAAAGQAKGSAVPAAPGKTQAPAPPAAKPSVSTESDPMLPQAAEFVRQARKPSISAVQRQFKIGYNRAAKLLEEMERDGVVSPLNPDGTRQVLTQPAAPAPQQPASAGFSSPIVFDSSPIPKMDPAEAEAQRRQFAEFEQKRKNRRAGTRAAVWERNPFLGFLGANGINRDVANEFAPGLVEKRKAFVPGYGPVFRPGAKNLDELVQNAKEDGFLQPDDDAPELYDMIDRALRGERIAPLYADDAAEVEGKRRQQAMQEREGATYEDYLAQQTDPESENFDPLASIGATGYDFGDDDLADYAAAPPALQSEVAALAQHYYDLGFDPDDVLERLSLEAENQPEQTYYDIAKSRFTQLLEQALAGGQGAAQQGSGGDVRRDVGQASDAQADGVAAGGQSQAADVAPQPAPAAAPAAAPAKRADAIRAKLDSLKARGFSQFTRAGGRNLLLNPGTYETIELSPAEVAVSKAMARQAKAGLQSLRGRREPAKPQDAVLQSYTPADVLTQQERASQQQADEQAARTRAEAKANDERKRIEQASHAAADNFELGQNPLDSLTGQQDIFSAPAEVKQEDAAPVAGNLAGNPINDEWTAFNDQSGTLGIPRAEMPQIKAEHRGAMMGFLKARGIDGQQETIPSAAIKPAQAEFSPAKVKKAMDREGGNRSIIVSADGHVVDGHHQWLAAREKGEPIQAIRLDQNIREVLDALKEMPSAQPEAPAIDTSPTAKWRKNWGEAQRAAEGLGLSTKDGKRNLKLTELVPAIEAELAKREKPQQQGQQNEGQDKQPAVNLDTLISVAADSIDKLRAVDVDRVISEAPAQNREALAQHIRTKRPDLAGEVDLVLEDAQPAVKPGADEVGSTWSRMTSIDREAAGLRAKLPKAAAAMWAKRGWNAIDSVIQEKLAKAMETPVAPAMTQQPEVGPFGLIPDPELITIFDQLNGRTERTREQGAQAAASSPQAERIQLVQANFHDILIGLMDAGQLEVNDSKTVNEDNQKCL